MGGGPTAPVALGGDPTAPEAREPRGISQNVAYRYSNPEFSLFFHLNSFTQSVFQVTFQIFHWRKDDVLNQTGKQ